MTAYYIINEKLYKSILFSISMENIEKLISKFKVNDEMDLMDLLIVLFYFGNKNYFQIGITSI